MLLERRCSGLLLNKCGFLISFLVCFSLYSVALINMLIFVREEVAANRPKIDIKYIFSGKWICNNVLADIIFPNKPKKYIASIWLLLLIDAFVAFGSEYSSLRVFCVDFRHKILHIDIAGEESVAQLYYMKRFEWSKKKFCLYRAYKGIAGTIAKPNLL